MRLLNAETLKFRDFPDESNLPPYAILSHTWVDKQEVTLQDLTSLYQTEKQGFAKVTNTCRLARSHGLEWAWIDTCCIDKTNSTELAEAINSMFRWYQLAEVCYVYLADFTKSPVRPQAPGKARDANDLSGGLLTPDDAQKMEKCNWFRRGWTLQELLAPFHIEFYDAKWTHIGSREQLGRLVSHITHIPEKAIQGVNDLSFYSIAQRMSWASCRVTTKVEDAAYCLLGIFDVNMPLIYGEGYRSFHRLQEQILKTTTDFTLFGWMPHPDINDGCSPSVPCMPLLASSPRQFRDCYDFEQFHNDESEITVTNRGLRLTTHLVLLPLHGNGQKSHVPLRSLPGQNSADVQRSRGGEGTASSFHHASSFSVDSSYGYGGPGNGLGNGGPHSVDGDLAISTASYSDAIYSNSAASSPSPPFRYVLTIGKRRLGPRTSRMGQETLDVGICLKKTGPGQMIREGNQPLQFMSRKDLRKVFHTTETHTFYVTLRPNLLTNRSKFMPPSQVSVDGAGPTQTPAVLLGHTPRPPQDARFDPSSSTKRTAGMNSFLPLRSKVVITSREHSNPAVDQQLPSSKFPPPHARSAVPPAAPPTTTENVLKYSELTPQHPLRSLYHPRLLKGIYIPLLTERNVTLGHFSYPMFDERLRIFCMPDSPADVISISCKSQQSNADKLSFSVLIDIRSGHSQLRCFVVDRHSVRSQFFFALSSTSHDELLKWHMVNSELPEIVTSSNRLRIKTPNGERTYEVEATLDHGPVNIDNYKLLMPTLDIKIRKVAGSG